MLIAQDYTCAICKTSLEENGKNLAVDHNHDTNQIRDLLCNWCNPAIGFLKENPIIARDVANYIEGHHRLQQNPKSVPKP